MRNLLTALGSLGLLLAGLAAPASASDSVALPGEASAQSGSAARLKTLYSNFNADPTKLYDSNTALLIVGPEYAGEPGGQAIAMPFTPSETALVTRIIVAVNHSTGPNGALMLSLNESDANGLPGVALRSRDRSNLEQAGTDCCVAIKAVNFSSGVSVSAGTQYWIVLQTTRTTRTTIDGWYSNNTAAPTSLFAIRKGDVWDYAGGYLLAFAVLGQ